MQDFLNRADYTSEEENTSDISYEKVKCTVVQALRLCTGCMAHRGSRGIALLYRH